MPPCQQAVLPLQKEKKLRKVRKKVREGQGEMSVDERRNVGGQIITAQARQSTKMGSKARSAEKGDRGKKRKIHRNECRKECKNERKGKERKGKEGR